MPCPAREDEGRLLRSRRALRRGDGAGQQVAVVRVLPPQVRRWLAPVPWITWAVFLALTLASAVLTGWGDRSGGVFEQHVQLARHYATGAGAPLLTYPLWGYPLAIAWLRGAQVVLMVQMAFGALVAALVHRRLARDLGPSALRTALFIAAVPWFVCLTERYPSAFAASFALLGILLLARGSLAEALAAGLSLGMAANFRSEYLVLPWFLLLGTFCARGWLADWRRLARGAALAALIALACQVPWGVHYYRQTGRFNLTESNVGHVALVSLGDLPGNPWGIERRDQFVADLFERMGYAESSYSETGRRVLMARYVEAIREHPGAFVRKVVVDLRRLLVGGFGIGDYTASDADRQQLDVLREKVKLGLDLTPNRTEIADYRARGLWDAPVTAKAALEFAALLVLSAAWAGVLVMALAGIPLAVWHRGHGHLSPLLVLLGVFLLQRALMAVLLMYMPRYMNDVALAAVPFAEVTLLAASRALGRSIPSVVSGG
jgi:hypothetical protein